MNIKDYITDTTREIKLVIHDDQPGETYAIAQPFLRMETSLKSASSIAVGEIIQGEQTAVSLFLIFEQVVTDFQRLKDYQESKGVRTTLILDGEEITDETQIQR